MGATLDIKNISISNSQQEAITHLGAKAKVGNLTKTGSKSFGILVNNGILDITNSSISDSTKEGIQVGIGGTLDANHISVTNSQADGISF